MQWKVPEPKSFTHDDTYPKFIISYKINIDFLFDIFVAISCGLKKNKTKQSDCNNKLSYDAISYHTNSIGYKIYFSGWPSFHFENRFKKQIKFY